MSDLAISFATHYEVQKPVQDLTTNRIDYHFVEQDGKDLLVRAWTANSSSMISLLDDRMQMLDDLRQLTASQLIVVHELSTRAYDLIGSKQICLCTGCDGPVFIDELAPAKFCNECRRKWVAKTYPPLSKGEV